MGLLAIAVFEAKKGKEEQTLAIAQELYAYLRSKGYSRDVTYRDARKPNTYLDIRMWASKEAATKAHQDPEVHKFWSRLAKVSTVKKVYELAKVNPDLELVV